jgi:RNA polymerase sigma factor (sigma-70 family)
MKPTDGGGCADFAPTRWTLVLAAGRKGTPESAAALETLCATYWYPLYAYARRHGATPEDAQDSTQGFFARLLEKEYVNAADRERGRFRAFLLTAFKRFLGKEREEKRAKKRGGGRTPLPLDVETAEGRYSREPSHDETPERIFERNWALTVIARALAALRERYAAEGKERVFDGLKDFLTGRSDEAGYAEAGKPLGLNEGAVKTAVHRLRRRFRELLREEVAQTVCAPVDVEDELNLLRAALED